MPVPDNDELEDALRRNAAGPKRASGDTGSIEQHSLLDQIKVDEYLAKKNAGSVKGFGMRRAKLRPPGAV